MKSAIGAPYSTITITGTWYHAATRGHQGRILRLTSRGFKSASGYDPTRFNPGNAQGSSSSFETLYLAFDGKTALFEKRVQYGDPFGNPDALLVSPKISKTELVPVDVVLDSVLDLSDVGAHTILETNAQEITGDWQGYQRRGLGEPGIVLTAPTGPAPTQQLAWELFHNTSVKGIVSISAKDPTTKCLVIFMHKMQPPDTLSWADPNTGKREHYP